MKTLGEKIKQLRFKKGLTQDALAEAVGSTKASISNYERDQRRPQYAMLLAIAKTLEVSVEELLTYVEPDGKFKDSSTRPALQLDHTRTRRVKKLLAAFERLSDEAQLKVIDHVEDLALVPGYQRPLPNVLAEYIYKRHLLAYEPFEDTQGQYIYEDSSLFDKQYWIFDIRHITLRNMIRFDEKRLWEFIYYSCKKELGDGSIVSQVLKDVEFPSMVERDLSFVFDDEAIMDRFFSYCATNIFHPRYNTYFILIDKNTGGIKNVREFSFRLRKEVFRNAGQDDGDGTDGLENPEKSIS